MANSRGSEWRIWDLHAHTPASFDWKGTKLAGATSEAADKVLDESLKAMQDSDVAVFGIQDHWTFEGYYRLTQRLKQTDTHFDKLLLPGIELRVSAPLDYRLNLHCLFSNEVSSERLETLLSRLELTSGAPATKSGLIEFARSLDNGKLQQFTNKQLQDLNNDNLFEIGCQTATVTFESLKRELTSGRFKRTEVLVLLPYSTSGGLKKLNWKAHPAEDLMFLRLADMYECRNEDDIELFSCRKTDSNAHFIESFTIAIGGHAKPCFSGTDAHSNSAYGKFPSDKRTWIKADPSFPGLLHAVIEPASRILIKDINPAVEHVRNNGTKYIDMVAIRKISDAELDEKWFDCKLPLNPGLVAIIGNRGSGKSALADIIALLGNAKSSTMTFLTKTRFRKRPNRAQWFIAGLKWFNGDIIKKKLTDDPDPTQPERVRYLSQERIEELCNEVPDSTSSSQFERELDRVVFQHIPPEKTLGKANLRELLEELNLAGLKRLGDAREQLSLINRRIGKLEELLSGREAEELENALKLKRGELEAHEKLKPVLKRPPDSGPESPESSAARTRVTELVDTVEKLESKIAEARRNLKSTSLAEQACMRIESRLFDFAESAKRLLAEIAPDIKLAGLEQTDLLALDVKLPAVQARLKDIRESVVALNRELEDSDSGLLIQLDKALTEKTAIERRLAAPEREYQASLAELKKWEKTRNEIIGSIDEPDSITFIESRLADLKDNAPKELERLRESRLKAMRNVVSLVFDLGDSKADLISGVREYLLDAQKKHGHIGVEFVLEYSCSELEKLYLGMVNQSKRGTFFGVDDGMERFRSILSEYDISGRDGALALILRLIAALEINEQDGSACDLKGQLAKGIERRNLYDLVGRAEWLRSHYSLRLDGKTIPMLSPGEKGALLIVFYLLLDPGKVPLVVDQPEQNLDNASVVKMLVPYFRAARESRQVIVVTHNPNLAVVCDADQVIHAKIDREDGNSVSYESGGLEVAAVNEQVVNVLEGTWKAFDARGRKYRATQGD